MNALAVAASRSAEIALAIHVTTQQNAVGINQDGALIKRLRAQKAPKVLALDPRKSGERSDPAEEEKRAQERTRFTHSLEVQRGPKHSHEKNTQGHADERNFRRTEFREHSGDIVIRKAGILKAKKGPRPSQASFKNSLR